MKLGPIKTAAVRLLPLLLLAALAAFVAGCGGSKSSSGDTTVPSDAVAKVGDSDVPLVAYKTLIHQQELQYKQQKRPFPKVGTKDYNALRDQITAYLIHGAEFEQKADEMGVKVTDKDVDAALQKFIQQQFGGKQAEYVKARKAQGLTEQDVRTNERLQLITNKLFTKITGASKVTDKDIRSYYTQHKSQYVTQDSRTVRHILVKTKAQADKLYSQIENGADFAKLAKKYSKDTGSAQQGGQLTISKGQTVPEFETTAFKLKTGATAKPVKTQFGWHVIQAVGPVKKASFVLFAKVKAQIKTQLEQTKKNDAMNKWVEGVQKDFCKQGVVYAKGYVPSVNPCSPPKTTSGTTATVPTSTG